MSLVWSVFLRTHLERFTWWELSCFLGNAEAQKALKISALTLPELKLVCKKSWRIIREWFLHHWKAPSWIHINNMQLLNITNHYQLPRAILPELYLVGLISWVWNDSESPFMISWDTGYPMDGGHYTGTAIIVDLDSSDFSKRKIVAEGKLAEYRVVYFREYEGYQLTIQNGKFRIRCENGCPTKVGIHLFKLFMSPLEFVASDIPVCSVCAKMPDFNYRLFVDFG